MLLPQGSKVLSFTVIAIIHVQLHRNTYAHKYKCMVNVHPNSNSYKVIVTQITCRLMNDTLEIRMWMINELQRLNNGMR